MCVCVCVCVCVFVCMCVRVCVCVCGQNPTETTNYKEIFITAIHLKCSISENKAILSSIFF